MYVQRLVEKKEILCLNWAKMKLILEIAITETHVLIKGTFYDQVDGIAMGPTLAPNLSDLFMRHHENK